MKTLYDLFSIYAMAAIALALAASLHLVPITIGPTSATPPAPVHAPHPELAAPTNRAS